MPERVQLRRTKGWRMPPNTVVVDRRSMWGNPYHVTADLDAEKSVRLFRSLFDVSCYRGNKLRARLHELRGKNLACWCPLDKPCHADVLLELANA